MLSTTTAAEGAAPASVPVGVAKVDITPDYPVRLTGYAGRKGESQGVAQRIWAKALAIGGDAGQGAAVLVTVDNCGVPAAVKAEVLRRLAPKTGLTAERLMLCSTHTHTGPWLKGYLPWLSADELPPEHVRHIEQYTEQLTGWIEQVVLDAMAARKPSRLASAQGTVRFAANRRVLKDGKWTGFGVAPEGPVDHSLPLLRITDAKGKLAGVLVNYACHCTTLGSEDNQIHGDWAGCAQQMIEADQGGAIALVSIGCGADANPEPRIKMEYTELHGREVADEVKRLLAGEMKTVEPALTARLVETELPFDRLPSREELERRAEAGRAAGASFYAVTSGRLAASLLGRLDEGKPLPTALKYPIAVWAFGDDLAMVFLAGEVVVDYSLALKRQFDASRLWITAYANDVPCYIASRRILAEGGYEADSSMIFYGQPTRLSPDAEPRLLDAVRSLVPEGFRAAEHK
ncbi:MAG: neutral/alkaline non-lysosomal ceramidase N-terminal domain-containing protein [Pirellulales bacterium]|nr:neutral/alkaline non-lysosomal ceramidase N-terminal domain-containing protein [Pirellulales bacterium]